MIRLTDGTYIIGVDNGYQMVKTDQFIMDNGVKQMPVEPSIVDHALKYNGTFYKVFEGRASITDDKVSDLSGLVLTFAAMAKELSSAGIKKATVILAVGLPFANYGKEKKQVVDYYTKDRNITFSYKGTDYELIIKKVFVFPQCYAAIAPRISNMRNDDYLVVDIGSKTVDVVLINKGVPNESKSTTFEYALINQIKHIQDEIQSQYGKSIPEEEIIKCMLFQPNRIDLEIKQTVRSLLTEFISKIEAELRERKYLIDYLNIIYVGGGAVVAKNFSKKHNTNVSYDCNVRANAKGYEYLARNIMEKEMRLNG